MLGCRLLGVGSKLPQIGSRAYGSRSSVYVAKNRFTISSSSLGVRVRHSPGSSDAALSLSAISSGTNGIDPAGPVL